MNARILRVNFRFCENHLFRWIHPFKSKEIDAVPRGYHKLCYELAEISSTSSKSKLEICNLWKRGMAGHSKWQNIKHTKEANDRAKAQIFQKFTFRIRRAVIENGGPDPKLNSKLASVIKEARTYNVPSATIETAIKRAVEAKVQHGVLYFMGPNNTFLIAEVETDNMGRTIHGVKQILKRSGSMNITEQTRTMHIFDYKGIIRAAMLNSGEKLNKEKAEDLGIEAEAEEVVENQEDNQDVVFDFITSPENFGSVKKALESSDVKVEDASLEYIPRECVDLDEKTLKVLQDFSDGLRELPEVVRLFDNIKS